MTVPFRPFKIFLLFNDSGLSACRVSAVISHIFQVFLFWVALIFIFSTVINLCEVSIDFFRHSVFISDELKERRVLHIGRSKPLILWKWYSTCFKLFNLLQIVNQHNLASNYVGWHWNINTRKTMSRNKVDRNKGKQSENLKIALLWL